MNNKNILEVRCSNKDEYDKLLEDYKSKGYDILERGIEYSNKWYFKCYKTN